MASSTTAAKNLLFIGATGGVGLSCLKLSLSAGHSCRALQRTPSKLAALLEPTRLPPANLTILTGNAHSAADVSPALVASGGANTGEPARLVDVVVFTIGAAPTASLQMDQPTVCEDGMVALKSAMASLRASGATGDPRVVVLSATGHSANGRDLPLLLVLPYKIPLMEKAHKDKRAMEAELMATGTAAQGGRWTIVRGALFLDKKEGTKRKPVRVGKEDPIAGVVEAKAIGYSISRDDVGKWLFENIVQPEDLGAEWVCKIATLTY